MINGGPVVLFDIDGNQTATATGSAIPTAALQIGGSDGTNLLAVRVDSSGRTIAVGAAAVGGAPAGNPVYIAGLDGTNLRALLTDTSGRQVMVGAAADGAAVTGNPVLMAGQDGTNAQSIFTDSTGRQIVVGAAADGAAVTGNPVLIAGQDGTNAQTLLTDSSGRLQVGVTASAAATATLSNVASSATSVTLLAANANRLGAIIVNDGTARLYVKFGTTASTTSFTVLMPPGGYYEVPFAYTGRIDGIWSVANGSARVTELEA